MTQSYRLLTIDVFTDQPLMGNPVAVIVDAEGLSDARMQQIAAWTNLSETTFIFPPSLPGADYHLRIFTPRAELPFAGHPTLGSAYAALWEGITPTNGMLMQQCGVGLVPVHVPSHWPQGILRFRLPEAQITPAPDAAQLQRALDLPSGLLGTPAIVNVGPRWVIAEAASAPDLLALNLDLAALAAYDRQHRTTGLTLYARSPAADGSADIVVRTFAPADGIAEDPVCGSGNGAVAAYLQSLGQTQLGDRYSASQGTALGRDGRVHVEYTADGILIGGACVCVADGILTI